MARLRFTTNKKAGGFASRLRCGFPVVTILFLLETAFYSSASATITFEKKIYEFTGIDMIVERAWGIIPTDDYGYLLTGAGHRTSAPPEDGGTALVKVDSFGNLEWCQVYDVGTGTWKVVAIGPDGIYIPGAIDNHHGAQGFLDAIVLKVKLHGQSRIWRYWTRGPDEDIFGDVVVTPDSGCIACGYLSTNTTCGAGVVRLNKDGERLWERIYRPRPRDVSDAASLVLMPDNGCIIHGSAAPDTVQRSHAKFFLMRIDANGEPVWTVYDTSELGVNWHWAAQEICWTPDSNLAVFGRRSNGEGTFACGVMIFDTSGQKLWDKNVLIGNSINPVISWYLRSGKVTPDGGFVMTGEYLNLIDTVFCIFLVRLDRDGNIRWYREYYGDYYRGIGAWDIARVVINTRDGGFAVLGTADVNYGDMIYIIKTDSLGLVYSGVNEQKNDRLLQTGLSVFPNPFSKSATIHYQLPSATPVRILAFDITGRTVATLLDQNQPAGTHQLIWQPEGLAQGVYFIQLETPSLQMTQRILLLH